MLLWRKLINEARDPEPSTSSSKDDLKLLQIYLCRLYLTPKLSFEPLLASLENECHASI